MVKSKLLKTLNGLPQIRHRKYTSVLENLTILRQPI